MTYPGGSGFADLGAWLVVLGVLLLVLLLSWNGRRRSRSRRDPR
ncbi:MAG: hypothetical protein ACPF9W_07695 [Nocardioides sp.]